MCDLLFAFRLRLLLYSLWRAGGWIRLVLYLHLASSSLSALAAADADADAFDAYLFGWRDLSKCPPLCSLPASFLPFLIAWH